VMSRGLTARGGCWRSASMGRLKVLNSGRFGSAVEPCRTDRRIWARSVASRYERRLFDWRGVRVVEDHAVVGAG
jgi:hypothetical protein